MALGKAEVREVLITERWVLGLDDYEPGDRLVVRRDDDAQAPPISRVRERPKEKA